LAFLSVWHARCFRRILLYGGCLLSSGAGSLRRVLPPSPVDGKELSAAVGTGSVGAPWKRV
jgi:hypothetical protein